MTFTVTKLIGSRALVRGTDVTGAEGQVVLDTTQWDELNLHQQHSAATAEFEAVVEEFFAPLTQAAEALGQKVAKPEDSLGFVVISEGTEAVPGTPAHVVQLSHDSKVLRLIDEGNDSRLVWVGDTLEILDVDTTAAASVAATVLGAEVESVNTDQD